MLLAFEGTDCARSELSLYGILREMMRNGFRVEFSLSSMVSFSRTRILEHQEIFENGGINCLEWINVTMSFYFSASAVLTRADDSCSSTCITARALLDALIFFDVGPAQPPKSCTDQFFLSILYLASTCRRLLVEDLFRSKYLPPVHGDHDSPLGNHDEDQPFSILEPKSGLEGDVVATEEVGGRTHGFEWWCNDVNGELD